MPRAPRDQENATPTPKKRIRKTVASSNGNGVHPENGKGAVEKSLSAAPEIIRPTQAVPSLEEKIRLRAYHLYLQRGGHGGSPEQDWLQAVEEISSEQSVA